MAIRTYKCTNEECQHEQEILLDSKGVPREEARCEKCDAPLEKQEGRIEATRFELKGTCWANNGYSK